MGIDYSFCHDEELFSAIAIIVVSWSKALGNKLNCLLL